MKKTFFLAICLLTGLAVQAQLNVNVPTPKTPASGLDPSMTGRNIMDIVTPKLKLSDDQNSKVTILMGQFLTHKSDMLELMKNKPADYKAKFADEQKILFDGLKDALNPEQFRQFMGLKPTQADTDNAMSHLFY